MDEAVIRIVLDSGEDKAPEELTESRAAYPLQPLVPPPSYYTPPQTATVAGMSKPPPPSTYALAQTLVAAQAQVPNQAQAPAASKYDQPEEDKPPDWLQSMIAPAPGTNPHVLLEGQSGSGKSTVARHIAFERMRQGQDVHVVDPHTPESWAGAKQVFQGENAGQEVAKFLRETLEGRIRETQAARNRGEEPDLKPMTVVFSDFARIMKTAGPELQNIFRSILTEGRKFKIGMLADTTAFNVASSGMQGILDVRRNFGQQAMFSAPTPQDPFRKAKVGGEEHRVPTLPTYEERKDYSLVKPPEETDLEVTVGAKAEAKRMVLAQQWKKQVMAFYEQMVPPEPPMTAKQKALKRVEAEKELQAVEAEYAKLKPPPTPLSAKEKALKRLQLEKDHEAVEAEYAKLTGRKKSLLLTIAEQLRGTIGGFTGVLIGAGLDALAAIRKGRSAASGTPAPTAPTAAVPTTAPAAAAAPAAAPAAPATAPPVGAAASAAAAGPTPPPTPPSAPVGAATAAAASGAPASTAASGAATAVAAIAIAAAVVYAIKKAIDMADTAAKKYGEYSPNIAQAQAFADINTTMQDMRRAQDIGPEMAEFVRVQNKLENSVEDFKEKVLKLILPIITPIMDGVSRVMDFLTGVMTLLRAIAQAVTLQIPAALRTIRELIEGDRDIPPEADPTRTILEARVIA